MAGSSSSQLLLLSLSSTLQGVRPTQEDRHCSIHNLSRVVESKSAPSSESEDVQGGYRNRSSAGTFALLGVFDGHNGDLAAEYCSRKLPSFIGKYIMDSGQLLSPDQLKRSFVECDRAFVCDFLNEEEEEQSDTDEDDDMEAGCTVAVSLINTQTHSMVVAHAGDTRCVVVKNGQALNLTAVDHKPDIEVERRRIQAAGHFVKDGRLDGCLAVSRAFGDKQFKTKAYNENCSVDDIVQRAQNMPLSVVPDVSEYQIVVHNSQDECPPHGIGDQFMIIACDGLWDVMSEQEAAEVVFDRLTSLNKLQARRRRGRGQNMPQALSSSLCGGELLELVERCHTEDPSFNLAFDLADAAMKKGSTDNVTVLLVFFASVQEYSTSCVESTMTTNDNSVSFSPETRARMNTVDRVAVSHVASVLLGSFSESKSY